MTPELPKAELLPTTHELKIWPQYYHEVEMGWKTAEYRKNDRDFKEGDLLVLREFNPNGGHVAPAMARLDAALSRFKAYKEGI